MRGSCKLIFVGYDVAHGAAAEGRVPSAANGQGQGQGQGHKKSRADLKIRAAVSFD
jgi:hypothetical protein